LCYVQCKTIEREHEHPELCIGDWKWLLFRVG